MQLSRYQRTKMKRTTIEQPQNKDFPFLRVPTLSTTERDHRLIFSTNFTTVPLIEMRKTISHGTC